MAFRSLPLPLFLSGFLTCGAAGATPELTPAQRALIFGEPAAVVTSEKIVRIPLEGTDHQGYYKCPYVQVLINGQGPFTFLFDTGSSYTSISSKVIEAAHIQVTADRGGYHDVLRVRKMRLGGLDISDLTAVRDDDFGVDGVFGFRAFGDMHLVFELAARQLLVSPDPVLPAGGFELPFTLDHNVPIIPVSVGTAQVGTLLDTGDDAYSWEVRSGDLQGTKLAHPPRPADSVLNGARSSSTYVSTLDGSVRLGPLTIEQAAVGINDALPVPDLGVDYLKDFNIEFDPKRMVITFQPVTAGSGTHLHGNLTPGFRLKYDDKGTVSTVMPGLAADQRGMRTGDRVLSIDGKPVTGLGPRSWDALLAPAKPLTVRWVQADGKEHTDSFEVVEFR